MKTPRLVLNSFSLHTKFLCACLLLSSLSVPAVSQQTDAQKHYDRGKKLFEKRDYAKSLAEAKAALKMEVEFDLALFLKSQALLEVYVREAFSASQDARLARAEQI